MAIDFGRIVAAEKAAKERIAREEVERALLREAADAIDRLHHSAYDGPVCPDCDLIRRLREAGK